MMLQAVTVTTIFYILTALAAAPFLTGMINRVKAFFGGRQGRPLLQLYYDLYKLVNKAAVYSRTTTWVFRAGPLIGLSAAVTILFIVPYGGSGAVIAFNGDLVLVICLIGLMRFFTVLAALDTGSSFEGMGASREAQFGALVEPAFFIALAALVRKTGSVSLSGIYSAMQSGTWGSDAPLIALAGGAMFLVFLAENCRVPVDDPNTHLELTMVHEAMVLDHSGPDLAFILYGAALKFWILGALIVGMLMKGRYEGPASGALMFFCGMGLLAILVGVVESIMARLRMNKVPQLLVGAIILSVLALVVQVR